MYLCVGLFLEPPVDSSLSSLFMFYVSVCPPRSLCSRFCVSLLAPGVPPSHSLLCLSHSDSLHSLSLFLSLSLSLPDPGLKAITLTSAKPISCDAWDHGALTELATLTCSHSRCLQMTPTAREIRDTHIH